MIITGKGSLVKLAVVRDATDQQRIHRQLPLSFVINKLQWLTCAINFSFESAETLEKEHDLAASDTNLTLGNNSDTQKVLLTSESELAKPNPQQCADNLKKGMSIRAAMLDAGYAASCADRGLRGVPKKVLKLMGRGSRNMMALGLITAQDQEQLVRGRLVYNTIRGQDKGVMSAYRLGQDRRVNMFVAESQTGIMVIQAPIREIGLEKPTEELQTAETAKSPNKSAKSDLSPNLDNNPKK